MPIFRIKSVKNLHWPKKIYTSILVALVTNIRYGECFFISLLVQLAPIDHYQLMTMFTWLQDSMVRYTNWHILHFDFEQEDKHKGCATKNLSKTAVSIPNNEQSQSLNCRFRKSIQTIFLMGINQTRVTCNCILSIFVIQEIAKN